jgi:succinoglycan biosynthesis transport protein ExoP
VDVGQILTIVWRRRLIAVTVLVLTVGAATAFALTKTAHYESTATIALTPDTAAGASPMGSENLATLLATYSGIAKSQIIKQRAEQTLGRPLASKIDAAAPAGGGILQIIANSTDANAAAADSGAIARAFLKEIRDNRLVIGMLITTPQVPKTPVQPRPPLIIGASILLGLFAALVFAFGLERLHRRHIETVQDLDGITVAPTIGRVPRQRVLSHRDPFLIWEGEAGAWLRESFRAARTDLQFVMPDDATTLLFTSPTAGAGKSTVVANMAVSFAQIGISTVVVDADMRRPMQHKIFGLDNARGLSMALTAGFVPEPQETKIPNLRVVTSGPIPADPTELLHVRLAQALQGLQQSDQLILVDSPPVLPVSDSRLIASRVDGVVLVLRSGGEKRSELQHTLERLALVDAKILGLILNMVGEDSWTEGGYHRYAADPSAARLVVGDRSTADVR